MNTKILAEMEFASIISEASAQTQTGAELLNKYKSFLMANESTCAVVNNFIRESQTCRYDNGVNEALSTVADYINSNKTSWALASACEAINNNTSSYNYLNRNASKQVEKLLEMNEEDVVKYIKAGALKNVMYCEAFRNIAKQVYKETPMVEATAEYTKITPVSLLESIGDCIYFEVSGNLFKRADDNTVQEAEWNEVSNTFKVISQLLESDCVTVDNHTISIKSHNAEYQISEANKVTRIGKDGSSEMNTDQLRENNRLVLMTTNPKYRNQIAGILEGVALISEHFDNIVNLDNSAIYSTKNDKFLVIESGNDLYATLLMSNHSSKWSINENAIEALSFIKKKTNTSISENYKEVIESSMNAASEKNKELMEQELKEQKTLSYKERIEALTEKFKNDPVKLAVLSKLAQELSEVE